MIDLIMGSAMNRINPELEKKDKFTKDKMSTKKNKRKRQNWIILKKLRNLLPRPKIRMT